MQERIKELMGRISLLESNSVENKSPITRAQISELRRELNSLIGEPDWVQDRVDELTEEISSINERMEELMSYYPDSVETRNELDYLEERRWEMVEERGNLVLNRTRLFDSIFNPKIEMEVMMHK